MLNRLRTRVPHGEDGFTLVELLIVIVILGVLGGIVVFAVGGINDNSKLSACKSDVKTVETALEARYAKEKTYAATATLVSEKFLRSAPAGNGASSNPNVVTAASNGDVLVDGVVVGSTVGSVVQTVDLLCA